MTAIAYDHYMSYLDDFIFIQSPIAEAHIVACTSIITKKDVAVSTFLAALANTSGVTRQQRIGMFITNNKANPKKTFKMK